MESHQSHPSKVRRCGPEAQRVNESTKDPAPTSERYEAATRALSEAWEQRPAACTAERERYESGPLKEARREVRAAWLEVAAAHGIDPDRF